MILLPALLLAASSPAAPCPDHTLNAKAPVALDAGARVWISGVLSATSVEVMPVDLLGGGGASPMLDS